jgi:hypothetical protein
MIPIISNFLNDDSIENCTVDSTIMMLPNYFKNSRLLKSVPNLTTIKNTLNQILSKSNIDKFDFYRLDLVYHRKNFDLNCINFICNI